MANYQALKTAIQQVVKTNGNKEITGALLQQSLLSMINSLGAGYQFIGIATPMTNPGTPDQKVFYLANEQGTYVNFGGINISLELAILYYDNQWHKTSLRDHILDIVTDEQTLLDKSQFEVYQVNTGSDPTPTPTGNRLRVILYVPSGTQFSVNCSLGKGVAGGLFDTLENALMSDVSTGRIEDYSYSYISNISATTQHSGYLCISLCKNDSSSFTAQDKADFIDALNISGNIHRLYIKPEAIQSKSIERINLSDEINNILDNANAIINDEQTLLDKSQFEVYQVNAGSDPTPTPTGNRLRVILYVPSGTQFSVNCSLGKGVAGGLFDTLENALMSDVSTGRIEDYSYSYISNISATTQHSGYLCISLCKNDSSSFTAQDKADFIDALNISGNIKTWIRREFEEIALYDFKNIEKARAAQKRYSLIAQEKNNLDYYLSIVHITDVHGDIERVKRAAIIAENIKATLICTGDVVMYNSTDDYEQYKSVIDKFMGQYVHCVGNHDVWQFNSDALSYDKYIAPFAIKQGWVLPTGHSNDVAYFYHDDSLRKIRFISVDQFVTDGSSFHYNRIWGQEQIDFIISALTTIPLGYGVIVVMHSPELKPIKDNNYPKFFQEPLWDDTCPITIQPLRAIIDAFISKTSINTTMTTQDETINIVANFANVASNEFICYITGHLHSDAISYVSGATNLQVLLNETCTNAWVNKNSDGTPGTSYPYFTELSDLPRDERGIIQDSFNVYVIDRDNHSIRIVRIGSDTNCQLNTRDTMSIPYTE